MTERKSEFEILFPIPEKRRNADDMGYPSPVQSPAKPPHPTTPAETQGTQDE